MRSLNSPATLPNPTGGHTEAVCPVYLLDDVYKRLGGVGRVLFITGEGCYDQRNVAIVGDQPFGAIPVARH